MVSERQEVDSYLNFLAYRFRNKITPSEYALSYSGGKDSHLLYWFIKEYLKDSEIAIVGVNTSFEIPEIRERIMRNSDVVLHPAMNRWEIKERYGIPCFSKMQDEYIYRYQHGNRSENTMQVIERKNTVFKLSKKAKEYLLSGNAHKISNKCCLMNKERPLKHWQSENRKKPIIAVRSTESSQRKAAYRTCLNTKGTFTPLYDWPDRIVDLAYKIYQIPIPKVYQYVSRTGCAGCPYGRHIADELALLPAIQREKAVEYFRESYDVKGVKY